MKTGIKTEVSIGINMILLSPIQKFFVSEIFGRFNANGQEYHRLTRKQSHDE
jgi:hypothetical protein